MSNNGKPTSANELILWDGTKFYSGKLTNSNIDSAAIIDGNKVSSASTSDFGTVTLTNDLGGTGSSPTVLKINGNPVKLETLTSGQDGYVLTWVDSDGFWEAKPSSGSGTLYGTFAARPVSAPTGTIYVATDGHSPWIYDGTIWRPYVDGVVGTAPPPASAFTGTTINIGSATITDHNGTLEITGVNEGPSTIFRGWVISTTVNSAAMICQIQPPLTVTPSSFTDIGVFMRESSTDKIVGLLITMDHVSSKFSIEYQNWTSNTARSVSITYGMPLDGAGPIAIRLRIESGNLISEYTRWNINDLTGNGWSLIRTDAITSVFTTAPDQEGIMTMGFNAQPHGYCQHFVNS